MISHSFLITVHACLFLIALSATSSVWASPLSSSYRFLARQTVQPYFPDSPPSCPICAQSYPSISTCAEAAPALANISAVIFNPGSFVSVIKCSCTDTFQSVFPQCVDCFERTNQTAVLDTSSLPSLVNDIRKVCSFASSIFGNASNVDGETTPSPSQSQPSGAAAASTGGTSTSAPSSAASPRNLPGSTAWSVIAAAVALIIFCAS